MGLYAMWAGEQGSGPQPALEAVVALALGVEKGQVSPVGGEWLSVADLASRGQRVEVQPPPGAGPGAAPETCLVRFNPSGDAVQSVVWVGRRSQPGPPCDAAGATAIAQDLGRRLLGDWPPSLHLEGCELLPSGQFQVLWRELEAPDVTTGLLLQVLVYAGNSKVGGWLLVKPVHRHTQDEVRVARADADAEAVKLGPTRGAVGTPLHARRSLLVLSYGPPDNDGPVWMIDVAAAGPDGTSLPGATVILDAVTGEVVPPGRRPQEGATNGTAAGPDAP